MSLIHWWPLNGDTQDTIGNIKLTGTFTSNASGKIGSCAQQNSARLTASTTSLTNLKSFSIAMWVKFSSTASTAWCDLFGFAMKKGTTTDSMRAEVTSNGGSNFSVFCNSISGSSGGYANFSLSKDVWTHLVFIKDGDTVSSYKNGVLSSVNTVANFADAYATGEFHIGDSNFYAAYNDVRIFDHILSQAEVKELSKALVIHYTFDDILAEPTTNLVTQGALSWSKLTVNVSSSHNNGVYTITTTTANNNAASGQIRANFPLAILTTGATYYFSCKYRVISGTGTFTLSDWCDSSLTDKKTKDCGDFYELSAKCYTTRTYNSTYRFLDCNLSANSVIEVWDVQLQTNDKVTPYVLGTRESMLYNETGLIQPTYNINSTLIQDSASGIYSLSCTGNTMINTPITGDIAAGATISCWVKTPTYPSANAIVFADYNSKLAFGFYGTQNAIISCGGYSASYVSNIKSSWVDGWNHIVVTRDGSGTISCYLNGAKLSTTGSNNWTTTSGYSTIGGRYNGSYTTYFTGYVDDYRVYHTLLSDADILDLYKTKAYITNKGDIETHQFIESKTQAQVTAKYCFEADEFYEELYSGYDVLEYIESTGTQYVDTGYVTTSTDYTYELDMAPTKIGGFYSYMGFMASGTTPRAGIHEYSNVFMLGANATTNSSTTPVVNERVVLKGHFKSGAQKLYKNGTLIASNSTSFNHSANTLSTHIFGRNYSSGRNLTSIKLYSAKIYEGSTLVRHYIPVRRQSDNALGLYDILTDTFCANSGSGTFTSGHAITNKSASIYEDMHVSGREIIEI